MRAAEYPSVDFVNRQLSAGGFVKMLFRANKIAGLIILALYGCGQDSDSKRAGYTYVEQESEQEQGSNTRQETEQVVNDAQQLQIQYRHHSNDFFQYRLQEAIQEFYRFSAAEQQPLNVWVNFLGKKIHKGFEPTQSELVCADVSQVVGSTLDATSQGELLQRLQERFSSDNANLKIVDYQPSGNVPTVQIHIGGTIEDLGCEGDSTVALVPRNRTHSYLEDMAFVFEVEGDGDKVDLYESVLGEVINELAFGIPSSETVSSGNLGLTGADGFANQNTIEVLAGLAKAIGTLDDLEIAQIDHLEEQIKAVLPPGIDDLDGLQKALSAIAVIASASQSIDGQFDFSDIHRSLIKIAYSPFTDLIAFIASMAGYPQVKIVVDIARSFLGEPESTEIATLPDLTAIFGFNTYSNEVHILGQLVVDLKSTAFFIDDNFDGEVKSALRSLVILAYGQANEKYSQ